MKAYRALLDEDPHDAETLFRRANEYYLRNDYIKALDDINNALKYLPEEDLDTRFRAIQLRANINMMLHRYEQAIGDLNSEISIDPQNYVAVYQRGTAFYELGRYPEAKADFRLLQQRNPPAGKPSSGSPAWPSRKTTSVRPTSSATGPWNSPRQTASLPAPRLSAHPCRK